jgi:hypothetical protein
MGKQIIFLAVATLRSLDGRTETDIADNDRGAP